MIDYLVLATSVVLVAATTSLVVTVFSYLLKWLFSKVCHIAIVEINLPWLENEKKELVIGKKELVVEDPLWWEWGEWGHS